MIHCSSCLTELPAASQFCLACGASIAALAENDSPTIAMPDIAVTPTSPGSRARGSAAAALDQERFPPGTLIVNRYRVVARVGRGGMGEVFRADDLLLGQPVALKFLSEAATQDINMLARFYDEVRIARQVTHPNVCRVYDIGEVQGQPYLSMEYIDGEDLGALLRRIGRLPSDKATEFSRKLCAGLAAAHARGVLHRDLKPGNIMIDGRGQVVITDFGLAALAEQVGGAEIRNGTPAYMAPEQLTGKAVSAQSDLYALGLVMYEMFTGRAPFEASTMAEMIRLREDSRVKNPSTLVNDMDPAVERTILRCLQADPKNRPASALSVSAALPGGDPLAAALAAGETPSPEVVAASGTNEGLRAIVAIALLAGVVAALVALCVVVPPLRALHPVGLENPPEVLAAKARETVRKLGYTERPADSASAFAYNGYLGYLRGKLKDKTQWDRALSSRPTPLSFMYRQSPGPLASTSIYSNGEVDRNDPFPQISGMVSVILDPDGRLLSFQAVPPQLDTAGEKATDWGALFAAADLDVSKFQPTSPQWVPLIDSDTRAAWTGTMPGSRELPIRVEAAGWRGRPVYFEIVWPWTKPTRMQAAESTTLAQRASGVLISVLVIGVVLIAVFMARQNSKAGRGDQRGAARFGLFGFGLKILAWVLTAHHVASGAERALMQAAIGNALLNGLLLWVLYLSLEPWVRRYWPQTIVTWSRVLSGQFRDPLVGRDLLLGVLFGLGYCLVIVGADAMGSGPNANFMLPNLMGLRFISAEIFGHLFSGMGSATGFFLMIFLLRAALRKQWLSAVAFVALWTLARTAENGETNWVTPLFWILVYGIIVLILMRFGLFALAVTLFLIDWIHQTQFTMDLGAWYGVSSLVVLLVVAGLAGYGFWLSLGRRQLGEQSSIA